MDADTRCPGCRHIPPAVHASLVSTYGAGNAAMHRSAVLPEPGDERVDAILTHNTDQILIIMDKAAATSVPTMAICPGHGMSSAVLPRCACTEDLSATDQPSRCPITVAPRWV